MKESYLCLVVSLQICFLLKLQQISTMQNLPNCVEEMECFLLEIPSKKFQSRIREVKDFPQYIICGSNKDTIGNRRKQCRYKSLSESL